MQSKKDYFVIAGGSQQLKFIKRLKERGFITHVFDGNDSCAGKNYADNFYHIDIKDKERIYDIAKQVNPVAIQAVITELGNITASWVGEKLGLRNNSFRVAINTTDKHSMKRLLTENNIKTPMSVPVSTAEEVLKAGFVFPILIKAPDSSASRGLSFVENKESINEAIEKAFTFTSQKKVIAEQFLKGREFAIETISSNGQHYIVGITELELEVPPHIMLSSRLMPARISDSLRSKIESFVIKLLNIFDIKYGACHIELFLVDEDLYVIEIASRLGGWRDMMVEENSGIKYLDLIIDASLNIPISVIANKNHPILVRSVLNSKDYKRYKNIKVNYADNIIEDNVIYPPCENYQAENLMESLGYYCIKTETDEEIQKFISRYE